MTLAQRAEDMRHRWSNGGRWKILGTAVVVSLVWAVVGIGYVLTRPAPFDPFGPYPVQEVGLPEQTVDVPNSAGTATTVTVRVLHVSADNWPQVPVSGVKCIEEPGDVEVSGSFGWRSLEPPGFVTEPRTGTRVAGTGCTTFAFRNDVPPDVRDRIVALAQQGDPVSLWQIQGTETPTAGGVTVNWQTENFAIVWEDMP